MGIKGGKPKSHGLLPEVPKFVHHFGIVGPNNPPPAFQSKFQCCEEDADPIQSGRQEDQTQWCHKAQEKGLARCSLLASSEPKVATELTPLSKFSISVRVESESSPPPFSGKRGQDRGGGR